MAKIRSEITYGNKKADRGNLDEWQRKAHPWTVTLKLGRRRMTIDFFTGQLAGEPTTEDVVNCLASDASTIANARSFEEWCADLGYEEDSRKAEKIYKAVKAQSERFIKFLGRDFDIWDLCDEDTCKAACE